VTTYSYSASLLRSATDSLGRTTFFDYNETLQLIRETDPLGGITEYEYDANGQKISQTDPLGHTTTWDYREDGLLSRTVDALGGVNEYLYDASGNISTRIDENGHATLLEYDELNRLTKRTNALGYEQTYIYDAVGNCISFTDADGSTTLYEYDLLDQLVREIDALGGVKVYDYDVQGNLVLFTNANGNTTTYQYDNQNRLVRTTDALGNFVAMSYDSVGNQTAITDKLGHTTVFEYDSLNQLVKTIDPLEGETTRQYDAAGNIISITDPIGRITSFAYNALNRRVSETDPLGATTQYEYDAAGNRIVVADSLGNTTQFIYNELNKIVEEIDPLGNSSIFTYDNTGNLLSQTDRNGRTTTFQYDDLDRLLTEVWWNGGTIVNTINHTYDSVGNLLTISDVFSSYTYTYDALGRILTTDNAGTSGSPNIILTHQYDAAGNTIGTSDNFGVSITSSYDVRDLLVSRMWEGGGVDPARIDFGYDASGTRTSIDRYADLAATQQISRSEFDYDAKGRLTDVMHCDALDAILADYDYVFDLADQLVQETHHGQTSTYTNDNTGQLVSADHQLQNDESYSYDDNGNRIGGGYIVGTNNQILSDGTYSYMYDNEGNMIRRTEIATGEYTEYTYDHRNRLVLVQEKSSGGIILCEVEYTYDALDRRIAKVIDEDGAGPQTPVSTHFVYDGEHVWADFDTGGTVLARYLFGDSTDEIIARWRPSEGTAWYLTDHLGTVRDIVNGSGVLGNTITYDSFGNILSQSNFLFGDRYTYTGREFDAVLGMYYYRARFYDPMLGRFISQDPLSFEAGDPNLYRFVGNSPLTLTDPFGMAATTESGVSIGKIAGRIALWAASPQGCFVIRMMGGMTTSIVMETVMVPFYGMPSLGDYVFDFGFNMIFAAVSCIVSPPAQLVNVSFSAVAVCLKAAATETLKGSLIGMLPVTLKGTYFTAFASMSGGDGGDEGDIPWGEYSPTGCEGVAERIKKAIGGTIRRITPKRGDWLGPYRGKPTEWGHHDVVEKDGRIYDAMTGPDGCPIDDYKNLWDYADDLDFGF
jgi:RHS repeat-associated protein